jgi:putative tryptophan/tyrosine transport system substrate-binding protein
MKVLVANVLALLLLAVSALGVRAADIAVVMGSDASAYQETLEGFKEVARHRIVGVQTLKEDSASWRDEIRKLRSTIEPDLIFAIGTAALQAVAGEINHIPVVHAMVFNPFAVANSSGKNITGISMIPSINQSISLLKELNPKYRRVGVIFDPSRSGPLVSQARSVAQKENIQLIAKEIRSPGEIAGALKSLENDIDALWLWPDEAYLGDEILQRIFLFSFERKVPVLGLSERHTQMGAVLSLSYASARDMGRQAAEAVNKLLGDQRAMQMPIVVPRQTKLTVNLKTARKLDVEVPHSITARADNAVKAPVYEEGDWWVFRIKTRNSNGIDRDEEHRVVFKNGKFETDDPSFLSGGDVRGSPSFLPFGALYFSDPERKWLDFPLLPGKTWSFRYRRTNLIAIRQRRSIGQASAEVIGEASERIQTAAGTFKAVQINRTDTLNGVGYLTYFYSAESKSVVKINAESITAIFSPKSSRQYELELIAYGTEGSARK